MGGENTNETRPVNNYERARKAKEAERREKRRKVDAANRPEGIASSAPLVRSMSEHKKRYERLDHSKGKGKTFPDYGGTGKTFLSYPLDYIKGKSDSSSTPLTSSIPFDTRTGKEPNRPKNTEWSLERNNSPLPYTRSNSESRATNYLDEDRKSPYPRETKDFAEEIKRGAWGSLSSLLPFGYNRHRPRDDEPSDNWTVGSDQRDPLLPGSSLATNTSFMNNPPSFSDMNARHSDSRGPHLPRTLTFPGTSFSNAGPSPGDMSTPSSYDGRRPLMRNQTFPEGSFSNAGPSYADRRSRNTSESKKRTYEEMSYETDWENSSYERKNISTTDAIILGSRDISTREPEIPVGFLNFKVGDVLDMPYRAKELRQFIKHGSIEEVYCALQKMHGEIETIDKLSSSYRVNSKKGYNLHADIYKRLRLDNINRDYVDQLLGKYINSDSPYKFDTPPRSIEDYTKLANRIQNALGSSDMQSVYAALTPLGRRTEYLFKLDDRYQELFQEDLHDRVRDQLLGPSRDYSLYLLGETKMETPFFTPLEADRLGQKLAQLTFIDTDGKQRKLPFKNPHDGCSIRAQVMNEAISEMGFANERIYIDAENASKLLRVETRYGKDTPSSQSSVSWKLHTTSTISVMLESSENLLHPKTEPKVLDPSLPDNSMGVERWVNHMGYSTYTEMSLESYKNFRNSNQKILADNPIVFFTPRHVIQRKVIPDLSGIKNRRIAKEVWNSYQREGIVELKKFSLLEKSHELAAKFRLDLERGATKEISDFLGSLERQPEELHEFANEFPLLLQQVRDQVRPPFIVLS